MWKPLPTQPPNGCRRAVDIRFEVRILVGFVVSGFETVGRSLASGFSRMWEGLTRTRSCLNLASRAMLDSRLPVAECRQGFTPAEFGVVWMVGGFLKVCKQ